MSITSASPWLFSETEQDVEERALADGLSCSTGGGNLPLTLVLVRLLHSCFFLADKFPSNTFCFSLQWINLFPDPSACTAGSVSGVCIPEDEGANGGTRCWSISLVAEGCGFINMVHFPHWKNHSGLQTRFLWSRNTHFLLHCFFPKGFREFQLHAFWQSQWQHGSQSLVQGFAG